MVQSKNIMLQERHNSVKIAVLESGLQKVVNCPCIVRLCLIFSHSQIHHKHSTSLLICLQPFWPLQCQAEMLEKLREIEAHYEILKKPLYKARGEVISRIPGFWLHCFMQHDRIRHVLGRVDQDILASLTKVIIS